MFKSPTILYFIFIWLLLSSCNSSVQEAKAELPSIPSNFKTIKIDSLTTFACPKDLLQVENLKLLGDYQFADLINVQYLVVQIDLKESIGQLDLESLFDTKLRELKLKMTDPSSNKLDQFSLNEIKGYSIEIEADVYGWPAKLHYWISMIELKDKLVTSITWTTEDRAKAFEKDAEMIVKSFRMKN